MKKHAITLTVNGEERDLIVPSNRTLLDALRDDRGYTDTKYGCGTGECGACTVLVDGITIINGCLTLAAKCKGVIKVLGPKDVTQKEYNTSVMDMMVSYRPSGPQPTPISMPSALRLEAPITPEKIQKALAEQKVVS